VKKDSFFIGQLIALFFVASILIIMNDYIELGLVITGILSLLILLWSKHVIGNYTNATVMFIAFNIFYLIGKFYFSIKDILESKK
jgi:hypothetical protein